MSEITYASAGVDIEAGDLAVELMKASVKRTLGANVLGGSGGFAGLYDISGEHLRPNGKPIEQPLLATSTDGVGTKVAIAIEIDKHDTIGYDLVGMVVDDIAVSGATPLFLTDYICCGHVEPNRIAEIVDGVARACHEVGVALIGGETAEHPGLLGEDDYDIAGAATGIIDRRDLLSPENVQVGDKILALASSGLHSNGFSLVRAVFESVGWSYFRNTPELGTPDYRHPTLGEALLTPTRLYSGVCLELVRELNGAGAGGAAGGAGATGAAGAAGGAGGAGAGAGGCPLRIFSHVTGGGILANLARVLPRGVAGVVNRNAWEIPAVFKLVQELGNVPLKDLEQTLNMGLGMLVIVDDAFAEQAINISRANGIDAFEVGTIVDAGEVAGLEGVVANTKGVEGGSAAFS